MKRNRDIGADALREAFGRAHFSKSQAHRVLLPKRDPRWIPYDSALLDSLLRALVIRGEAEVSVGPRGGSGWRMLG